MFKNGTCRSVPEQLQGNLFARFVQVIGHVLQDGVHSAKTSSCTSPLNPGPSPPGTGGEGSFAAASNAAPSPAIE